MSKSFAYHNEIDEPWREEIDTPLFHQGDQGTFRKVYDELAKPLLFFTTNIIHSYFVR
jgi:hypothetical protein